MSALSPKEDRRAVGSDTLASGALFLVMLALLVAVVVAELTPSRPAGPDVQPLPGAARDTAAPDAPDGRQRHRRRRWRGLPLREAMYYRRTGGGRVACDLCPRRCTLDDGQRGVCGTRVNLKGTLYTLVYAKPVALQVDPIEKKPLYHFMPGARAFSIATAGCNLGCVFCQNWHISQALPERARYDYGEVPPAKVVALAESHKCKVIAYTYTEPTVFYEYMLDCARAARKRGIRNVLITCGYINPAPLRELCKVMDAANIDLKGYSEDFYRDYCGARLQPVLDTIKIMREEGVWIELTNLVIPQANDDSAMIRDMCRWIVKNVGVDVPVHFSAFRPAYKLLDRPQTPAATLLRARRIALAEGIRHVYVGNVVAREGRDTVCPACGEVLIRRKTFFVTRNRLRDGRCPRCGRRLAGVWTGDDARR